MPWVIEVGLWVFIALCLLGAAWNVWVALRIEARMRRPTQRIEISPPRRTCTGCDEPVGDHPHEGCPQ